MPSLGIDMSSVTKYAADLQTASGRVGREGRRAVDEQAKAMLDVQKRAAPVRTGKLRDDLGIETLGDGRSGSISAIVGQSRTPPREGFFQENGTSRMPAHPFVEPSAVVAEREWPGKVDALMEKVSDGL